MNARFGLLSNRFRARRYPILRTAGFASGRILQSRTWEHAIAGTKLTPNPDATSGKMLANWSLSKIE